MPAYALTSLPRCSRQEPELLAVERERVERSIQNNTVAHYKAFIETASCLQTVHSELDSVSGHLDALLQVRARKP